MCDCNCCKKGKDKYYTVERLADYLDIGVSTIHDYVNQAGPHHLPDFPKKVLVGIKAVRFDPVDVEEYLRKQKEKGLPKGRL
ncbi:helix-turn-helix domain-containing protein [Rhodanobacter sp. A1T4]|uniref:helix-turn-helix transcriptional regulator n=1 Tax=Rhodanobacter sp. A1T4 TaxID=2723087 RepID=UPI0021048971|nr:helix-turn-helix domain-containing protein [Rhodanobacter sp. A1T4]